MATAHVTAGAAILMSFRPQMNSTETADMLFRGVETEYTWSGPCTFLVCPSWSRTKGRLDLFQALSMSRAMFGRPAVTRMFIAGLSALSDSNTMIGQIAGTLIVKILFPEPGGKIKLYFADKDSNPMMAHPLPPYSDTEVTQDSDTYVMNVGPNITVPLGATKLAAYSWGPSAGIFWGGQGAALPFTDVGSPIGVPIILNTSPDQNAMPGRFYSYTQWQSPDTGEASISHYKIYQVFKIFFDPDAKCRPGRRSAASSGKHFQRPQHNPAQSTKYYALVPTHVCGIAGTPSYFLHVPSCVCRAVTRSTLPIPPVVRRVLYYEPLFLPHTTHKF